MSKATKKKEKVVLPCTIDPNLFNAWKKLRRAKDSEAIALENGWSRPPIDNALNYGHVKQDEIVGQINTFFKNRLKKEAEEAAELMDLQAQIPTDKK